MKEIGDHTGFLDTEAEVWDEGSFEGDGGVREERFEGDAAECECLHSTHEFVEGDPPISSIRLLFFLWIILQQLPKSGWPALLV